MSKGKKIPLIICGIIIMAALAVTIIISISENGKMKKDLIRYGYSSSGDMRGAFYSREICVYDDTRALMIITSQEWYNDDEKTEEYLIDGKVLNEIAEIFRDNHMNRWKNRNLSRIFVADGATDSYSFSFGDDDYGFSSQAFPPTYALKLKKIDDVIKKYSADKEKLPGLVFPEKTDEEKADRYNPVEGEITFNVSGYKESELSYILLNGCETEAVLKSDIHLFNSETSEEISLIISKYASDRSVSAMCYEEGSVKVKERLARGTYRLECGEYSAEFEIA